MHDAGIPRTIRNVVFLSDRQRIDVRAESYHWRPGRRRSRNSCDDPAAIRPRLMQDSRRGQLFAHEGSRAVFGPAKLRIGMKTAANLHKLRRELDQAAVCLLERGWQLSRFSSAHGGKEPHHIRRKINRQQQLSRGWSLSSRRLFRLPVNNDPTDIRKRCRPVQHSRANGPLS